MTPGDKGKAALLDQLESEGEDEERSAVGEDGRQLRDRLALFEAVALGEIPTIRELLQTPPKYLKAPPRVPDVNVADPVSVVGCPSANWGV